MQYVIEAVQPSGSYNSKFGQMNKFSLKLQGMDVPVELSQKAETPPPALGPINGTIDMSGPYGPKFKKEFAQGGNFQAAPSSNSFVAGSAPSTPSPTSKGKFSDDPFTMYLSYAKDLVVALQQTEGYDAKKFAELLSATIKGGKALYDKRPGAEPEQSVVEEVFGDIETVDQGELPWPGSP